VNSEEEEGGGGGEGRKLTCGGSRYCWRRWRWQDAAVADGGGVGDDGLHSFFPCFFFSSCFFSFLSLGCLLSIPILLLSSFSLSLSFFLALPSPVFIGKKQGRERTGRPLCCRPSNTWKALGYVGVFLKGKMAVTEEEKIFFFPCFARPGEEEDPQCRLKQHYLGPFF
jgi:hypothetical protein